MFDRIIAIGGPTGSGKSSLAMELAHRTGGEIVSCAQGIPRCSVADSHSPAAYMAALEMYLG